ncbi:hypothetical protein EB796_011358 [Bugula neritina]|uniref:Cytochrome P450 n=1 Tax=Bugula neritina TaxID=10212 RepID=A0A7J7JWS2_BUGNE|nr:hypothetical protein EB796_011358 [Bugula neritina]
MTGGWICLILIALCLYYLYRIVKTAFFSPLLKIPGLPYGPLYGNVKEAMQGESMDSSVKWVRKYGGIVRFYNLFGREQILLADPEAIRYVLVTHSSNYHRRTSTAVQRMVPEGLFSLEGSFHRSARKLLNPAFNIAAVKSFLPLFHKTANKMADKMSSLIGSQDSSKLNMQKLIKSATMDVIGLAAFDHDLQALDDPSNEIVQSLSLMIASQAMSLISSLPFYDLLPLKSNKKYKKAVDVVDELSFEIIKSRRRQLVNDSSVFSKLLSARYEGKDEGLSDTALRDHIVSFMVAGYETSSSTLTWLMLELARNPDMQEKLHAELSLITDYKTITGEDLESFRFLDSCIKETLRLYPAASAILRNAVNDDIINGYEIPAGTELVLHFGAMMRTQVENGEIFDPNRFLSPGGESIRLLPFGIGPHACIGNKFAIMEMKLLTVYLVREFNFSTVPGLVIHRKRSIILKPSPDVELYVTRRG